MTGSWAELLLPSLRSALGVCRLEPGLGLLESDFVGAFLTGFFFSLANLACRATREILWVLGELDPEGAGGTGLEAVLEGTEAGAEAGALALAVVVIRRPAAVFLAAAFTAEEGLGLDVIVVLARVILGLEALLEVEKVVALTLLAKEEVGLT